MARVVCIVSCLLLRVYVYIVYIVGIADIVSGSYDSIPIRSWCGNFRDLGHDPKGGISLVDPVDELSFLILKV